MVNRAGLALLLRGFLWIEFYLYDRSGSAIIPWQSSRFIRFFLAHLGIRVYLMPYPL